MPRNNRLLKFIRKQSFNPGPAALFVNPYYLIRRELHKHIKAMAPGLRGRLLDFGCGRKPYEHLFTVDEYIGLDMEQTGHEHTLSKVDVYYDGKNIPFGNETFDSIFCSEVFEHIFNLDEIIPEISRVLKPGGQMLITVPFCWHEHEVPYDFGRYTSFGTRDILEKHGFEVVQFQKSGHFTQVVFQLWSLYFYDTINMRPRLLALLIRMIFTVPINITGTFLSAILPRNRSLYFNNIVLARKK